MFVIIIISKRSIAFTIAVTIIIRIFFEIFWKEIFFRGRVSRTGGRGENFDGLFLGV